MRRLADAAHAASRGEVPTPSHDTPEPYRSILSDIHSLAKLIQESSQSAVEEKNRLLAILESMTEGVLVVDTEQKILLINSALARAFGFEKSGAAGRFSWEMFRDPDINEMIQAGLKQRSASRREHEALLSDSVFEIQVSPVFTEKEFLGIVAVFRDITALKRFDRLRSEFVANVSHELKTPLTSILGFVETLKEGALDDPEHRLKFLNIIEAQSKKLHAMIEDLLLLSRLESSKEPMRPEAVELSALLEKIEEVFEPILREKDLRLETEAAEGCVQVEPASFERALSNLVDNAVKYNKEGGRVTVRATRDAQAVRIVVSDTGVGIAAQDLGRIFERFYRSDKSRSRESLPDRQAGGGSGLGLSIAKHIVERHGGRIEVESAHGQGSTFTIILPK